jgi:hypothetical protein
MKRFLYMALGLLLAAPVLAQVSSGNIFGTVTDEQGAVLAGVTVTLSGDLGTRTTTSGTNGEFRFLALDNGAYKLTVGLTGFAKLTREVRVTTAENVNLNFTLKVASVEETVQVVAETPLVDTKKRGTSTTIISDELQKMPSARDPWGILKNVPGVTVDRVNIGGNSNGQQAGFGGHGSVATDAAWNLDGLVVTDMSATGASASYYDFDAFQEIAVSTGGADLNMPGGGVGINFVTKRGTNKFHGGAHYLYAGNGLQSSNLPASLATDPRLQNPDGSFRNNADHTDKIEDWGFDLGGPILKDKLWFYGSLGRQQVNIIKLNGVPDQTTLKSYNAKLNWQATSNTMVSAFWFNNAKVKLGRDPGITSFTGLQETPSILWNQGNLYSDNPYHGLWKLQVDETFSPNFFVSAKAAYYNTGFGLITAGPQTQTFTYDYVANQAIGSYESFLIRRPQKDLNVDANYFFQGVGGNNELKFGFGYRSVSLSTSSHYAGNGISGVYNPAGGNVVAKVHRDGLLNQSGTYLDFYVGDTWTKGRFSLNVGVRYDQQKAKNDPSLVPANPGLSSILPALNYPGDSTDIINWKNFEPRVGLNYAFDAQQKTVGRLSYSRYAQQLSFGLTTKQGNPVAPGALVYSWNDLNGDRYVQPNEVLLSQFQYSYGGINPGNPATATSPNAIDRNLGAQISDEIIAGIDHQLAGNFAVGVAYIWRRNDNFAYYPRLAAPCSDPTNPTLATCPIIQANQYVALKPITSGGYTVTPFAPPAALVAAGNGGRILTNMPGYTQNFNGVDVTLTKRMSNKWMARVAATYNLFKQDYNGVTPVNGQFGLTGTTAATNFYQGNPTPTDVNSLANDLVATTSSGSGPQTYYTSPKWQIYANALVQLPWDIEFGGAVFGRQGQISPQYINARAGADGTLHVLATPLIDAFRLDNVWDLDLRLAKNVKIGPTTVVLSAEGFNIFNSGTVLQAGRQVNSTTLGQINEILAPRIFRLGARFSF